MTNIPEEKEQEWFNMRVDREFLNALREVMDLLGLKNQSEAVRASIKLALMHLKSEKLEGVSA